MTAFVTKAVVLKFSRLMTEMDGHGLRMLVDRLLCAPCRPYRSALQRPEIGHHRQRNCRARLRYYQMVSPNAARVARSAMPSLRRQVYRVVPDAEVCLGGGTRSTR